MLLAINGAIVYYFYDNSIKNVKSQYEVLIREKEAKEQELASILRLQAEFPELEQVISTLTDELRSKLKKLPNKSEIPNLLKSISREANKSGMKITMFKPEPEIQEGFFFRLPIKIEASGSYHQLVVFCDKISRMSRIVNVLNTSLTKGDKEKDSSLNFKFDVITYRFKDRVPDPVTPST
jgi:type IV pilus assembly protein PilO